MRLFSLFTAAIGMMTVARAIPTKRHSGEAQRPLTIVDREAKLNIAEATETNEFIELWDDEGLVKRIVVSRLLYRCLFAGESYADC